MFDNTREAVAKLKRYIGFIKWVSSYGTHGLMIIYLTLALIFGLGNFIANAILLPITIAVLVCTIVFSAGEQSRKQRRLNKRRLRKTKNLLKAGKILVNTYSLGVTLYGMFIAASMVSPISIVLTTLLIIMWIVNVIVEIIQVLVDYLIELFTTSIKKDFEWVGNTRAFATEKVELVKEKAGETIEVVKSGANDIFGKVKSIFQKDKKVAEEQNDIQQESEELDA